MDWPSNLLLKIVNLLKFEIFLVYLSRLKLSTIVTSPYFLEEKRVELQLVHTAWLPGAAALVPFKDGLCCASSLQMTFMGILYPEGCLQPYYFFYCPL